MIKINKSTVAKIFLVFVVGFLVPVFVYSESGREAFEMLVKTAKAKERVHQYHFQRITEKYKNKRIRGEGYIATLSKDIEGNSCVYLSTEKKESPNKAVSIIVCLRGKSLKRFRKKIGRHVYFSGRFREIRMRTIVVHQGIIYY